MDTLLVATLAGSMAEKLVVCSVGRMAEKLVAQLGH